MKKSILFFAALAALVSCTKGNLQTGSDAPVNGETVEVSFKAYAPVSEDPDLKSILQDNHVLWEDGDEVKVIFPKGNQNTSSIETHLINTFTTSLNSSSSETYFNGTVTGWYASGYDDQGFAVYPNTVSYFKDGYYHRFLYDLEDEQIAGPDGSFGRYNLAISYIYYTAMKDHKAAAEFLNSCALLKLILSADVASVEVSSNSGVALSGAAQLKSSTTKVNSNYDLNGDGSVTSLYDFSYRLVVDSFTAGNSSVALSNGAEGLKAGVPYHIVVWPGTHSGLTFTFYNAEGKTCKKTLNQSVVLEAAKYDTFNFTSEFVFTDEPELEISKSSLAPVAEGETLSFELTSNGAWTISESADWIEVSPASGSEGTTAVNVTVNANATNSPRTATITVSHAGGLERTINVSQDPETYKINGSYLTYASDLTDGLYVISNVYSSSMFWTESNGKLSMSSHNTSDTFYAENVFEYKVNNSGHNGANISGTSLGYGNDLNYYNWSAGTWKSLSTGKYLDESFNLTAEDASACTLQYANNWGGNDASNELYALDVYKYPIVNGQQRTLWYYDSAFAFGDMNYGFTTNDSVGKRKYYVYRVVKQ